MTWPMGLLVSPTSPKRTASETEPNECKRERERERGRPKKEKNKNKWTSKESEWIAHAQLANVTATHTRAVNAQPNGKFFSPVNAIGSERECTMRRGQIPVDQKKRKEFVGWEVLLHFTGQKSQAPDQGPTKRIPRRQDTNIGHHHFGIYSFLWGHHKKEKTEGGNSANNPTRARGRNTKTHKTCHLREGADSWGKIWLDSTTTINLKSFREEEHMTSNRPVGKKGRWTLLALSAVAVVVISGYHVAVGQKEREKKKKKQNNSLSFPMDKVDDDDPMFCLYGEWWANWDTVTGSAPAATFVIALFWQNHQSYQRLLFNPVRRKKK